MKIILIGLLALSSISAFASECRIHISPIEMGENFPSATALASKVSKRMKSAGAIVVKDVLDANVGLQIRYTFTAISSSSNNGPYGRSTTTNIVNAVQVIEYRDGKAVSLNKYLTTDSAELAERILADIKCL